MDPFLAAALASLAVAIIVAFAMWALLTAQRLHRLHIRLDSSLLQLRAALDRRAAVVAAVVPGLATAASAAEATGLDPENFAARRAAEQELSLAIAAAGADTPGLLVDANARVQLAHRFYNEAVADTRALRLRPMVKACRLGGTARMPEFFDLAPSSTSTPTLGE
ncbi:hypothetical protein CPHO_05415 [Corynebacterium phocae]|uniref:NUDIX hydrolase n=1 Tax=Corynebacterium phocae TaxID=161895 RepID=A0A1L7D2M1_9CORY|nr:hypothetical protein [Corynebacterium phocae]APT92416.1 hypothetical protein CPHO_05415 [Corynebacterium phocae]KAA8725012.1 hypothetical protein F4V58_04950 [Corynebacterium phocae]